MSVITDPKLQRLLDDLHSESTSEEAELGEFFSQRAQSGRLDWKHLDDESLGFLASKMVALDADKAEFSHMICRALRARRVVEVGTSNGVSTLYLADAVRANGGGVVVATESEAPKAAIARSNFAKAGVAEWIDLREGDLRETLKSLDDDIDFALIDIWTEMALPAIELISPHLRAGAVVLSDNTTAFRDAYAGYLSFINDPVNGFISSTLPFQGGLEFSVKVRPNERDTPPGKHRT